MLLPAESIILCVSAKRISFILGAQAKVAD
jgi:hypothetical protein